MLYEDRRDVSLALGLIVVKKTLPSLLLSSNFSLLVALHSAFIHVRSSSSLSHARTQTRSPACISNVYERPVARRWRRALAYAKWSVRVRAWRVAFDEIYLAPGNAGALRAEEHFRECAEHEAGEVPTKRVKLVE